MKIDSALRAARDEDRRIAEQLGYHIEEGINADGDDSYHLIDPDGELVEWDEPRPSSYIFFEDAVWYWDCPSFTTETANFHQGTPTP